MKYLIVYRQSTGFSFSEEYLSEQEAREAIEVAASVNIGARVYELFGKQRGKELFL
jgi:hypothetical protein